MLLVGHDSDSTFPFKPEPCGNRRSFQCPFHLWSFDLDGKMIGAPGMDQAEDFDKKDWSLPKFSVELWGGFIFVNLDANAEPLAPQLKSLDPFIEAYEIDRLRTIDAIDYECDWNWKLSVEAGSESYHHLGLHQDLLEGFLPAAMSEIEPSRGPYSLYRNPTADGSPVPTAFTPPAGLSDRQRSCLKLVTIFPYTMFFMMPEYTGYLQLTPQSHDKHKLRYVLMVHPNIDDHPNPEEVATTLRASFDAVHQQGMAGGQCCWAGAQSRLAKPGRRSPLEKGTPYDTFNDHIAAATVAGEDNGEDPELVASMIVEVATTEEPKLRWWPGEHGPGVSAARRAISDTDWQPMMIEDMKLGWWVNGDEPE